VGRALREAAGLRVLCTSRQTIGTVGEHVYRVPPLPVDADAVSLFAERATAAAPGFVLTGGTLDVVRRICRDLDGLPLAIELAAAQLRMLSVDQLAARLSDSFRLLTTRHATPDRHRTLEATFDWSFALCSPAEQALWSRVAVFAGSFDLGTVEQVCGGGVLATGDVATALAGLVDKSVLVRADAAGRPRYRLLETIRRYGLRRLGGTATVELRRRHRDRYLALAERFAADWFGPRQAEWSARIRADLGNLRAALTFCLTTPGEGRYALELAAALESFWAECGASQEGRLWLERGLAAEPGASPARLRGLGTYTTVLCTLGDLATATTVAAESRELAARLGDPLAAARGAMDLGMVLMLANDLPAAVPLLEEAVSVRTERDASDALVATGKLSLAMTVFFLGDVPRAADLLADCRAVCLRHGEQSWRGRVLVASAYVALATGDTDLAEEYVRGSLQVRQDLGDTMGIAGAVERMGWIAADCGQSERAARLLGAADQVWRALGRKLYGAPRWIHGHEVRAARLREAMGDDAFDKAFRLGAALRTDEAVAYALGREDTAGPGSDGHPATADSLTPREREVAALVAEGLSNREIAARLSTSRRTAESHVEHILRKLGFTSRTQVATWMSQRLLP
jgi:non-specific serine/threonine protein kinase